MRQAQPVVRFVHESTQANEGKPRRLEQAARAFYNKLGGVFMRSNVVTLPNYLEKRVGDTVYKVSSVFGNKGDLKTSMQDLMIKKAAKPNDTRCGGNRDAV